ncbi:hypothetical protein HYH03_004946 [Edaphochlamys debaryana]|uniref:Uncharacterized protein n=1 Tax=Edaphochlamys debaryana TaxID=47281 RepID=A0A835YDS0_9CHLO|nr:hypothetical protein HYH03_004946 [Edaphochlamys debaryana]|eukprot:KAG2496940.1 hypothetical protein HYH03_004946 [Edaphochlamys debaryana]
MNEKDLTASWAPCNPAEPRESQVVQFPKCGNMTQLVSWIAPDERELCLSSNDHPLTPLKLADCDCDDRTQWVTFPQAGGYPTVTPYGPLGVTKVQFNWFGQCLGAKNTSVNATDPPVPANPIPCKRDAVVDIKAWPGPLLRPWRYVLDSRGANAANGTCLTATRLEEGAEMVYKPCEATLPFPGGELALLQQFLISPITNSPSSLTCTEPEETPQRFLLRMRSLTPDGYRLCVGVSPIGDLQRLFLQPCALSTSAYGLRINQTQLAILGGYTGMQDQRYRILPSRASGFLTVGFAPPNTTIEAFLTGKKFCSYSAGAFLGVPAGSDPDSAVVTFRCMDVQDGVFTAYNVYPNIVPPPLYPAPMPPATSNSSLAEQAKQFSDALEYQLPPVAHIGQIESPLYPSATLTLYGAAFPVLVDNVNQVLYDMDRPEKGGVTRVVMAASCIKNEGESCVGRYVVLGSEAFLTNFTGSDSLKGTLGNVASWSIAPITTTWRKPVACASRFSYLPFITYLTTVAYPDVFDAKRSGYVPLAQYANSTCDMYIVQAFDRAYGDEEMQKTFTRKLAEGAAVWSVVPESARTQEGLLAALKSEIVPVMCQGVAGTGITVLTRLQQREEDDPLPFAYYSSPTTLSGADEVILLSNLQQHVLTVTSTGAALFADQSAFFLTNIHAVRAAVVWNDGAQIPLLDELTALINKALLNLPQDMTALADASYKACVQLDFAAGNNTGLLVNASVPDMNLSKDTCTLSLMQSAGSNNTMALLTTFGCTGSPVHAYNLTVKEARVPVRVSGAQCANRCPTADSVCGGVITDPLTGKNTVYYSVYDNNTTLNSTEYVAAIPIDTAAPTPSPAAPADLSSDEVPLYGACMCSNAIQSVPADEGLRVISLAESNETLCLTMDADTMSASWQTCDPGEPTMSQVVSIAKCGAFTNSIAWITPDERELCVSSQHHQSTPLTLTDCDCDDRTQIMTFLPGSTCTAYSNFGPLDLARVFQNSGGKCLGGEKGGPVELVRCSNDTGGPETVNPHAELFIRPFSPASLRPWRYMIDSRAVTAVAGACLGTMTVADGSEVQFRGCGPFASGQAFPGSELKRSNQFLFSRLAMEPSSMSCLEPEATPQAFRVRSRDLDPAGYRMCVGSEAGSLKRMALQPCRRRPWRYGLRINETQEALFGGLTGMNSEPFRVLPNRVAGMSTMGVALANTTVQEFVANRTQASYSAGAYLAVPPTRDPGSSIVTFPGLKVQDTIYTTYWVYPNLVTPTNSTPPPAPPMPPMPPPALNLKAQADDFAKAVSTQLPLIATGDGEVNKSSYLSVTLSLYGAAFPVLMDTDNLVPYDMDEPAAGGVPRVVLAASCMAVGSNSCVGRYAVFGSEAFVTAVGGDPVLTGITTNLTLWGIKRAEQAQRNASLCTSNAAYLPFLQAMRTALPSKINSSSVVVSPAQLNTTTCDLYIVDYFHPSFMEPTVTQNLTLHLSSGGGIFAVVPPIARTEQGLLAALAAQGPRAVLSQGIPGTGITILTRLQPWVAEEADPGAEPYVVPSGDLVTEGNTQQQSLLSTTPRNIDNVDQTLYYMVQIHAIRAAIAWNDARQFPVLDSLMLQVKDRLIGYPVDRSAITDVTYKACLIVNFTAGSNPSLLVNATDLVGDIYNSLDKTSCMGAIAMSYNMTNMTSSAATLLTTFGCIGSAVSPANLTVVETSPPVQVTGTKCIFKCPRYSSITNTTVCGASLVDPRTRIVTTYYSAYENPPPPAPRTLRKLLR